MIMQFDKKEYGIHFKILKFYSEQGMRNQKIHVDTRSTRGHSLNCTSQREQVHEIIKKKLLNISLFRKTMENVQNRVDF